MNLVLEMILQTARFFSRCSWLSSLKKNRKGGQLASLHCPSGGLYGAERW